jgi:FixJ family two-component response regulator
VIQEQDRTLVYIVEDDASVRKAMARLMRTSGLEVREFASQEEFLDAGGEPPPDCVLLDITVAGITGPQVKAQLNERAAPWPVIAVSASEDDLAREASRQLGAQLFLRKPVDGQALLDAIAWVTGQGAGGRTRT